MTDPAPDPGALVDAACVEPLREAAARLDEGLEGGLLKVLREGLLRQREVIDAIGLEREPPEDWETRADGLLEYRQVAVKSMLQPLHDSLAQGGPSAAIADGLSAALKASYAGAEALPTTITAPWPEGALARRRIDGSGKRLGKFFARMVSAARKPGRDRPLPLRAAALEHVERVVAPGLDRAVQESLDEWAAWSRDLELAWVAWADTILPVLVQSELPEDEDYGASWIAIRDAALQLEAELTALAEAKPSLGEEGTIGTQIEASRERLGADLAIVGSFLHNPSKQNGTEPSLTRTTRVAPAFSTWEVGIATRLRMYVALLSILAGATGVQRRLLARFRAQCTDPVQGLLPVADALDSLASGLGSPMSPGSLSDLQARTSAALVPVSAAVPGIETVDETVLAGSDSTVEALLAMVRQAPPELEIHGEGARVRAGARKVETRSVPLQELARQSFDALRIERIRSATSGLVEAVDRLRENVSAVAEVFPFAHEAALAELEGGEDGAELRATELVKEALGSTSESLRGEVRGLREAVEIAQGRLATEISEGAIALIDRLAAGRMQAQLLAASSRVADVRVRINEAWGPPLGRALRRLQHVGKVVRRFATRGLRKGSEIVGGASGERVASTHAVKTLANSKEVTERLPLVYQRLFAFDALTDAALLMGRTSEMADAMSRWRRWQTGDGVPLILHGRQGSGITSFLNAFCTSIEGEGGSVARIGVESRVTDECQLTDLLAQALALPSAESLSALASGVLAAPPGSIPQAAGIDDLEHLYLRVPRGTELLDRLLTFMAETEPRIFWIGGITTSAWQLLSVAEPTAISQVDVLDLLPLGAADSKAAIIARHRRSGLSLRYEEPKSGRRMFRRRLRRARDAEAHQAALEADFFDQLERASSGHLRLALFQWLQCSDLQGGDGLMMHSPQKPDFALLESLSLVQNFTLKAFLEHRTLTLSEHDRIFRLPTHDSYQIFESLGKRHLIESVRGAAGGDPARSDIEADTRYQVPELLIGAIVSHLRSRNIVH